MMWLSIKLAFLSLLFLTVFVSIHHAFMNIVSRKQARTRLLHVQSAAWKQRLSERIEKYGKLHQHLHDLIKSIQFTISIGTFVTFSLILFLIGFIVGAWFFHNVKGVIILSVMLGSFPYLSLRFKLITQQLKARMEFLPAAEIFYQYYVLSVNKNIRSVLKEILSENRIQYPLKPVFEQLLRQLSIQNELDDALRIFTLALGHRWAEYFASILRVGLLEGVDVSENLKEVIGDMRSAQRSDQLERNRLLEIRIANFSPLLFLSIFLFINFKINFTNAFHYYVLDSAGRNMLLDSFFLIFASFLMGVYLSIKRM